MSPILNIKIMHRIILHKYNLKALRDRDRPLFLSIAATVPNAVLSLRDLSFPQRC
jgi:hypothetical protein